MDIKKIALATMDDAAYLEKLVSAAHRLPNVVRAWVEGKTAYAEIDRDKIDELTQHFETKYAEGGAGLAPSGSEYLPMTVVVRLGGVEILTVGGRSTSALGALRAASTVIGTALAKLEAGETLAMGHVSDPGEDPS